MRREPMRPRHRARLKARKITVRDHGHWSGRPVTTASQTPLMQQYREIKGRHQNAILFFRMGEFYEMFYDDAETASRVLGLTLTSRNNGGAADVPLAGVPVKAAQDYVRRLVQQGFSRGDLRAGGRSARRQGSRAARSDRNGDARCGLVRRSARRRTKQLHRRDLSGARADGGSDTRVGVAAADVSTGELRLIDSASERARSTDGAARAAGDPARRRARASRLPASRHAALVTERDAWEFDAPARARGSAAAIRCAVAGRARHRRDRLSPRRRRRARCSATCASSSRVGYRSWRVRSSSGLAA